MRLETAAQLRVWAMCTRRVVLAAGGTAGVRLIPRGLRALLDDGALRTRIFSRQSGGSQDLSDISDGPACSGQAAGSAPRPISCSGLPDQMHMAWASAPMRHHASGTIWDTLHTSMDPAAAPPPTAATPPAAEAAEAGGGAAWLNATPRQFWFSE